MLWLISYAMFEYDSHIKFTPMCSEHIIGRHKIYDNNISQSILLTGFV